MTQDHKTHNTRPQETWQDTKHMSTGKISLVGSVPSVTARAQHSVTSWISLYNQTFPYTSSFIQLDSYSSSSLQLQFHTPWLLQLQTLHLQLQSHTSWPPTSYPLQLQFYTIQVPCSSRSLQVIPYSSSFIQFMFPTAPVPELYSSNGIQLKSPMVSAPCNSN